jgi:hypothetical protein
MLHQIGITVYVTNYFTRLIRQTLYLVIAHICRTTEQSIDTKADKMDDLTPVAIFATQLLGTG